MDGQLSDKEHAKQLRRAVIASTIGTTIEWYDFFLYSTVTGLVFAKLYFPESDPFIGTLQAFSIYAVGFIARPIGALVFGHYGDRIGRKATLIWTLVLMGVATFAVGLVPSYESIGIWGAVILTVLRFIQGIGVGGEWGGSILLSMEWSKNHQRGLMASWPQFGVPAGLFLANLAVLFFSYYAGDEFLTWGWRVPFLISGLFIAVGLVIRIGIVETPTFRKLVSENKIEKAPMREVIRRHPWQIIQVAFLRLIENASFYIFTAFVFAYGTQSLGLSRDLLLTAVLTASLTAVVVVPFAGHLSDKIGRKKMYIIGILTTAIYAPIYFALLNTGSTPLVFLAVACSLIPHAMLYGPQGALIAELFTGRLRYSGSSLGYQLTAVIGGGPAPMIAAYLIAVYHNGYAIAAYIVACAVISLVATLFVRDYTNRDISEEYDASR